MNVKKVLSDCNHIKKYSFFGSGNILGCTIRKFYSGINKVYSYNVGQNVGLWIKKNNHVKI